MRATGKDFDGVISARRTPLHVVAGILIDVHGRVLLAERLNDHPFAGLWEFPGGKVDANEVPAQALRRELFEELAVEIVAFEPFLTVEHDYPDRRVEIDFFLVSEWRNEPRSLLNQRLRWVTMDALLVDELLPANAAVVEALRRGL